MEDLDKDLADFQALKDFMTNLEAHKEVVNNHLAIYLMNLRNSLEVPKVEEEDHKEPVRQDKEGKIS